MEFKGFLLCFAFFFVVASGATVCKCGEEQKKKSVSEFAVKLNDGRKEIDEKITVDTENETETFHLEDDDTGNIHEVLFDFRRDLSMYRIPHRKVCLLRTSTDRQPKPGDLIKELESDAQKGPTREEPKETIKYVRGDPVDDRSFLSDEMANMCAKLPIYYLVPESVTVDVEEQKIAKRRKRNPLLCTYLLPCAIIIIAL
ncbi:leukocyte cell-derived chemotaxin 1-like [Montipora foliosa]|uniref:leukocyte cell-derived chemotaxin 1-like n=1 Tax=Montipora foliosa TaxID=591990 RepID=UPI0035F1B553